MNVQKKAVDGIRSNQIHRFFYLGIIVHPKIPKRVDVSLGDVLLKKYEFINDHV